MKMKLRPLGHRMLVKMDEPEEHKLIPQHLRQPSDRATVMRLGRGNYRTTSGVHYKFDVEVGQKVILFSPDAGHDVGDNLRIISESDILAMEGQ